MKQAIPDYVLQDILKLTQNSLVRKALRRTLKLSKALRKRKMFSVVDHPNEKSREIYDMEGKEDGLPGKLVRTEGAPEVVTPEAPWLGKTATFAYENAGDAYDYYLGTHRRFSLDGHGMKIVSCVNYGPPPGEGIDNAFWNGQQMVYGNGTVFLPLAMSRVVAGHEFTHALTNLMYFFESGAINEHISDVFGVIINHYANKDTIDSGSYLIGEDIVTEKFPGRALRDMGPDPAYKGDRQPKHKKNQYWGFQDNGGVHINSGILNHAFYKFVRYLSADGLEQHTYGVPAQIWYEAALACKQWESFKSFKKLTMTAADKHGVSTLLERAWKDVGV